MALTAWYYRVGMVLGLTVVLTCAVRAADFQNNYNGASLEGRSFARQDLKQAKFYKANLRGSNFEQADLRGASFFAASLRDSNLRKARLDNSELSNADLQNAKLDQAVLSGAFMIAAKLENVSIQGTDFSDVLINNQQKAYLCKRAGGTNTITKRQTRTTLGC
ncbi:MAG: pentapeptide repeat-containing protein [Gemmatimonadaceae bacterium]|nr:pentapeptide repeat-containing protein [Gloeobacterales cyanobacterium ES-bin-141]